MWKKRTNKEYRWDTFNKVLNLQQVYELAKLDKSLSTVINFTYKKKNI